VTSEQVQDLIGQRDCGIEGRLVVRIAAKDDRVEAVDIGSTRPLGAASILEGRPVLDAVRSLKLLYSLCGTAHTVAGLDAAEQALGIAVPETARRARQMLVDGESIGQLLWRLMLDLPQMVGEATAFDALRDARARIARLSKTVYPRSDWVHLGGGTPDPKQSRVRAFADTMDEIAVHGIYGEGHDASSVLADPESLGRWAARGDTPIARIVRTILDRELSGFGANDVAPLPELDVADLAARLAADDDRSFCSQPTSGGIACETGALPRFRDHPLIAELIAIHGAGLLAELAAKIVAVAELTNGIRRAAALFGEASDDDARVVAGPAGPGTGLAIVDTARGRLVHYVELEGDRTKRYRILAPTEWNFHPQGPLAMGLKGMRIDDADAFLNAATLFVTAIDPCVQFDIILF